MIMAPENKIVVGVDVAKESLAVSVFDGLKHEYMMIDYTQKAIKKELLERFKRLKTSVVFVMEATGVYHSNLAHWLYGAGFDVAIINPLIIKRYTQMKMTRVKTDKSDCVLIAEYGFREKLNLFKPKSKESLEIGIILKTIEDFLHQKSITQSQRHALMHQANYPKEIVKVYENLIKFITQEIRMLKEKMQLLLKEHFINEYTLLSSIKGIGLMSSAMIVSIFDSFKNFDTAKQAASFVGIAPAPYESGTSVKKRGSISKQGSPLARKLLYMATLSGMQFNELLKVYYTRLLENGKSKKQAMIAVSHKLLRIAFGVLKHNKPFTLNHVQERKMINSAKKT
jgi:transposase